MTYNLHCQFCGKEVERNNNIKITTCYLCKKQRRATRSLKQPKKPYNKVKRRKIYIEKKRSYLRFTKIDPKIKVFYPKQNEK